MSYKNTKICRLCFKLICDNNFDAIENISKHMMEVLLLNLVLDVSKQPVMCGECATKLQKSFDFKSVCLNTENKLQSISTSAKDTKLSLLIIYLKENRDIADMPKDQKICRICIQPTEEGYFTNLLETEEPDHLLDILQNQIPEVDLSITEEPVICKSCCQSLLHLYSFIKKCCIVEETITRYIEINGTDDAGQVDLNNVHNSDMKSRLNDEDCKGIKEECKGIKEECKGMEAVLKTEPKTEDCKEVDHLELMVSREEIENILGQNYSERMVLSEEVVDVQQYTNDSEENAMGQADRRSGQRKKSKKKTPPEKFHCDKCDYVSIYKSALASHMVRHKDVSSLKMHKCEICGHETKRIADLRWHMIIHKDPKEVKLFYCADCTYKTKRKGDLKQHVMIHRSHTFKCAFCSFSTKNDVYLNTVHILLHKDRSEVRTYKCESCSYETINKGNLKAHSKTHRDPSEVEKFKCNWCDFETTYKQGIRIHQLIHTCKSQIQMFKCYSCDYEATRKAHLKDHMLRHVVSSETYDCSKCSFKTKRKDYIRRHMEKHKDPSDIKMYKCEMCAFQTKRKGNLKSHMFCHVKNLQTKKNKQEEIKNLLSKIHNMTKA